MHAFFQPEYEFESPTLPVVLIRPRITPDPISLHENLWPWCLEVYYFNYWLDPHGYNGGLFTQTVLKHINPSKL